MDWYWLTVRGLGTPALEDNPSLSLPASGGCRHSLVCGCITPIFVFIFTLPSPLFVSLLWVSLIRTLVFGFMAHLIIQNQLISRSLTNLPLQRLFFQIRSQSQLRWCGHIFWGETTHLDERVRELGSRTASWVPWRWQEKEGEKAISGIKTYSCMSKSCATWGTTSH